MNLTSSFKVSLILYIISYTEGKECQLFLSRVKKCPTSKSEYEIQSNRKNCHGRCDSEYHYHCLRGHGKKILYELCFRKTKITGFCPEFNVGGQVVQNDHDAPYEYPCADKLKCSVYINSTDVYKYPECFRINRYPPIPLKPDGPFPPKKPFPPSHPGESPSLPPRKRPPPPINIGNTKLAIILILVILGTSLVSIFMALVCYEKYKMQTSWMKALRQVIYCIWNFIHCKSNHNGRVYGEVNETLNPDPP